MKPAIRERVLDMLRRAHDRFGPVYSRWKGGRIGISYPGGGLGQFGWRRTSVEGASIADLERAVAFDWLTKHAPKRTGSGSLEAFPRYSITEAGVRAIGRWPEEPKDDAGDV